MNNGWGNAWAKLDFAARSQVIKERWARMLPGFKQQFLERISEAARRRAENLGPDERRAMTAVARSKRWEGHDAIRLLPTEERRRRKAEYMRRYRLTGVALIKGREHPWHV